MNTMPLPATGTGLVNDFRRYLNNTSIFLVDVDLGCGAATTTKHYRVTYLAPGQPALEELPGV